MARVSAPPPSRRLGERGRAGIHEHRLELRHPALGEHRAQHRGALGRAARLARPAQPRGIVGPGAVAGAEGAGDAIEDAIRSGRGRRLVQRGVDRGRRPSGEAGAGGGGPVAAAGEPLDGQPGRPPRRARRRRDIGHVDPHLGESPRGVQRKLAAADVGRVVDLEHHVRQVVHADDQPGVRYPLGECGAGAARPRSRRGPASRGTRWRHRAGWRSSGRARPNAGSAARGRRPSAPPPPRRSRWRRPSTRSARRRCRPRRASTGTTGTRGTRGSRPARPPLASRTAVPAGEHRPCEA